MNSQIHKLISLFDGEIDITHALQSKWPGSQWIGNGSSIDDFPDFEFENLYDPSVEEGTRGREYMVESAFEEYCLDHLAYARFLG